jgi:glycosyltransferase involved in cell wall biosynthesis
MHVLIIPSWYPHHATDPHGSFFREQAIALHKAGMKVGVAAVELHSLRSFGRKRLTSGIIVETDEGVITYRKRGWSWFPNMNWGNLFLWSRHSSALFKEYVAAHGLPDVIHAHSLNMGGMMAGHLARATGRPFIITEHNAGYITRPEIPAWDRQKYSALFRSSFANLAVSNALAVVMNRVWPEARCQVVANVVDDSFFSQPLKTGTSDVVRFITVGHLTARKNIALLIRAFAKAKIAQHSCLTIVGDGEDRSNLERLAAYCGASDRVAFVGRVERDKMAEIMVEHDAFALASNGETFGVVVAEALAVGLPVVSTRSGGPEDIVDASNGLLVAVGDEAGLARALEQMAADLGRYDKNLLRSSSKEKYGAAAIAGQLLAIYQRAVSQAARS